MTTIHTTIQELRAPETGLTHRFLINWQDQTHECCGQTWATWDKDNPPRLWWIAGRGEYDATYTQCRNCGSSSTADYNVTELD